MDCVHGFSLAGVILVSSIVILLFFLSEPKLSDEDCRNSCEEVSKIRSLSTFGFGFYRFWLVETVGDGF